MPYTLVQHTGYSVGGKLDFKNAVEERSIRTKREERAIRRAGGVVYTRYEDVRKAMEAENYPDGYKGIVPKASGRFAVRKAFDEPIYVPRR